MVNLVKKIVFCIVCNKEMLSSKHSKTCSKECFNISLADPNRKFCKGRKPYASNKYGSRSFKYAFVILFEPLLYIIL